MVALILLIGLVVVAWVTCYVLFNDLMLPTIDLKKYRNILFVYAHMDDETVLAGGIMARAVKEGKKVTLMTLTRGEKGNNSRVADNVLPAIRQAELDNALSQFGVKNLIHLDYEDETLTQKKVLLKRDIGHTMRTLKPDLVVTFDLAGWYGHADHIACAEAVTEVRKEAFKTVDLWYSVRPDAINRAARLVAQLTARGPLNARPKPQYKISILQHVIAKIRAVYGYRSQMAALRPGVTIGPVPMWFFMSTQPYEYIISVPYGTH